MTDVTRGSLFSTAFLESSIRELDDWRDFSDEQVDALDARLREVLRGFPIDKSPGEAQTEDDLIWPIIEALGWRAWLRQQTLSAHGRENVPDGLLFADEAAKERANRFREGWKRYEFGVALVESKRWMRPLDRQSGHRGEETAPSTQMLRYLRRVDDLTTGRLRWGCLTNGARWRLYYQGARSVSEQFFEIDLAAVLDLRGHNDGPFPLSPQDRRHWLRVFALVFRREAFLPGAVDSRTFHQRALDEGRFYEQRVAGNLSNLVFGQVFPDLTEAIAARRPEAPLADVREAALVLLYRLLFVLYAEDRNLLPVRDPRYDDYGLRSRVREDVGRRKDLGDTFSETQSRYWSIIEDLCRALDEGDASIGLPPYNGGLFDAERTPLLDSIRLGDRVMANVIDALSFEATPTGRRYINYRDLSVQQLGSIYERLLEYDIARDDGTLVIRPAIFARKSSGSYYTPDDLVRLIIRETLEPLIEAQMTEFAARARELEAETGPVDRRLGRLKRLDPATRLLDLKICDPAMGSGHFLVGLVDYLADRVIAAMAEAEAMVTFGDYSSPLLGRIDDIRITIGRNADDRGWTVDLDQLDDRHIVRRMILKRCVYGVDKNPMAVELAKVSLWLHTFTVGAPLSFIDHHLRCGDSLFGLWVRRGIDRATAHAAPLLLHGPTRRAMRAATSMLSIERLSDTEIAEVVRSADFFEEVQEQTAPLDAMLSLVEALEWLDLRGAEDRRMLHNFFDGQFGDPVEIAEGRREPASRRQPADAARFAGVLAEARQLIDEERFFNWQVAFPNVWQDWEAEPRRGGFDAVIGNPPWDRMKLQQVEWFAARRREIAMAQRAASRKRMIAELEQAGDPLAEDYAKASRRAEAAVRVARRGGDYPLLSGGDVNIYSLFVERAMALVRPDGMVGLLTPSGIASDKTAAPFFKAVATEGRLKALYDFENRRTRFGAEPFFPDIDSRFKFCVFVASPRPTMDAARCAFFVQDISELVDPDRCFPLNAADFARVNPNTGTAPIFRSRRDADLTTAIYERLPVLVDRSGDAPVKAWPVRYATMFHMTNDSHLFRTREELEEHEGAYPVGGNRFRNAEGDWLPLYVGRMINQFDHRAASVQVNAHNLHNAALSEAVDLEQKADPGFSPIPQYWVNAKYIDLPEDVQWVVAFRDIARATDVRTSIASAIPRIPVGNTAPIIVFEGQTFGTRFGGGFLANLNSLVLDYVVRQKAQTTHLNWYIVEQLPVVPPMTYVERRFGAKTAGEIVREAVLELTYTAHDMAPFARDMGHVDAEGNVLPPFRWDEERRLRLRAKLDAVYFHLYGVTDRDDVRYVFSTFPIVERQERRAYGRYRSRDLCLAWMNALAAGEPDAEIDA